MLSAGFEDGERETQAKERERPLKAGRSKDMDLFLQSPERNAVLLIA